MTNTSETIKKTILEMAKDNYDQLLKTKGGPIAEVLTAELGAFKRVFVRLGFKNEANEINLMLKAIEKMGN